MIKDRAEFSPAVCLGVLQHHEKINGSGYPMGVSAEKICPYAKILSVADIYDALVTERPYKKAYSQRDAVEMIMSMTMACGQKYSALYSPSCGCRAYQR